MLGQSPHPEYGMVDRDACPSATFGRDAFCDRHGPVDRVNFALLLPNLTEFFADHRPLRVTASDEKMQARHKTPPLDLWKEDEQEEATGIMVNARLPQQGRAPRTNRGAL